MRRHLCGGLHRSQVLQVNNPAGGAPTFAGHFYRRVTFILLYLEHRIFPLRRILDECLTGKSKEAQPLRSGGFNGTRHANSRESAEWGGVTLPISLPGNLVLPSLSPDGHASSLTSTFLPPAPEDKLRFPVTVGFPTVQTQSSVCLVGTTHVPGLWEGPDTSPQSLRAQGCTDGRPQGLEARLASAGHVPLLGMAFMCMLLRLKTHRFIDLLRILQGDGGGAGT